MTFWAILNRGTLCKNCCGIYLGNFWNHLGYIFSAISGHTAGHLHLLTCGRATTLINDIEGSGGLFGRQCDQIGRFIGLWTSVASLVERLHPTPQVCTSYPVIGNFYLPSTVLPKHENKEKEARNGPMKNHMLLTRLINDDDQPGADVIISKKCNSILLRNKHSDWMMWLV